MNSEVLGEQEKKLNFVDMRALIATMMVAWFLLNYHAALLYYEKKRLL